MRKLMSSKLVRLVTVFVLIIIFQQVKGQSSSKSINLQIKGVNCINEVYLIDRIGDTAYVKYDPDGSYLNNRYSYDERIRYLCYTRALFLGKKTECIDISATYVMENNLIENKQNEFEIIRKIKLFNKGILNIHRYVVYDGDYFTCILPYKE